MRGAGTLRNIIGKPLYGKKKKQQQEEEADLLEGPAKKQKLRKASSTGGAGAVGQRSIFNFFSVAAAPTTAEVSPSQDPLTVPQTLPTGPEHRFAPRCKSAPVQRSLTPDSTPASESPGTSSISRSSDRAPSPPANNPTLSQQQHHQQQQGSASPWDSAQPSGPLLVSTRMVGRQHQSSPWPPGPGCQLLLQRDPANPVDSCAILVCSVDGYGIKRTHGHLPAAVSCHLAPLMDRGDVTLQVQLGQPPAAAAAAAAGPSTASRASTPEACQDAAAAAESSGAAAAAAAAAASGGSQDVAAATAAPGEPAASSQFDSGAMLPPAAEEPVPWLPAAEAVGDVNGQADVLEQQQQQEQRLLQLQVVVLPEARPDAAAAALAAVDRAASAGLDSVAPGRSSGAMLAAAFEHIISETRKHDLHLLSQQEQAVLQHMQVLPAAAKALLLRLLLRKRTWFQLATLAYADVPQPDTAASRLAAVGLLQWGSDAGADLDSLLQELPVVVLKQVLAGLLPKGHPAVQQVTAAAAAAGGGYAAPNKAVLISSIQANACRVRLQAAIAAAAGPCVAVTPAAADTFARLQLLYFASPGHDLNMFVAVERGAVRYPAYPIQRTQPVFSSRQQVLEYEQALAAAAAVDAALEAGDTDTAWQQLQPALSALQAGVHKAIVWDEACAPLPNPPPRQLPGPAGTLAAATAACTNTGDAVCDSPVLVQSATRQEPSVPAEAAAENTQQPPSVAAAAAAAPVAAGTIQQLPSAAAAAGSPATYTVQQPPPVAGVGPGASMGPLDGPQQPAGGPGAAGGGVVQVSRLSSESGVQYVVGSAVQSVHEGSAAGVLLAAAAAAGAAGAAGGDGVVQQLGDLQHTSSVKGSPGPEVCDLTQVSSSDVSWDTSDSDGRGTTAADGAESRGPAEQRQQEACAQADCSLELASQGTRPQGQAQAAQDRQQQQQDGHQMNTMHAPAAMATSPVPQAPAAAAPAAAAAAAGGSASLSPGAPAPPLFFARFCAGWVYASLGTVAASLLEKRKAWGEAVELLRLLLGGNACVGRRGEWWTRLAINLEHLGRTEDALEAVEAALADSWVRGGDLLGLQRRYLRLGKPPRRWRRPHWATAVGWEPPEVVITARPLNNTIGAKSRFYGPDNALVTVEQLALQHYASQEGGCWQGLHCEGGVWASLFTLLLWDVIFMGVPDVFRSPFQTCPLDLDTDAFYPTRRSRLEAQLSSIADGQAGAILSAVWAANAGVMARGVNWQRFTQQQLLEICECVGGLGLAAVLRLMAEDHAGAAGGLPDLLLWRAADRCAKLVEVKGPRDRLSHQQRFWLAHMSNNTLQVEVLKVKEPQSSSRRK